MARKEEPSAPATVREALNTHTIDELKKRLALLPVAENPTRKGEIADLIADQMEGERLRTVWGRLDETQQGAVAETLYAADGRFDSARFLAKYGKSPDWGSVRGKWGYDRVPSLLQLFLYGGLLPEDLKAVLKAFVPRPAETVLETFPDDTLPQTIARQVLWWDEETKKDVVETEDVPVVYRDGERAAASELLAVLRLIEAGRVSVSDTTRFPTGAAQKAILDVLTDGDYYDETDRDLQVEEIGPIRPFAWPMVVQAAGLAELSGKKLTLTRSGQKALTAPPHETLRVAWQKWGKTKMLDELRRVSAIKGQTGKGKAALTALEPRRRAISEALAECPMGQWVDVGRLFRFMIAEDYSFEVTRDPWTLYVNEPGYGALGYDGFHDWAILQARYALCFLFEYAATLGLLDVAYVPPHGARPDYRALWGTDDLDFLSRYDGLLLLRLNPLGAYCLGLADGYVPAPEEAQRVLEVRPDLTIIALDPPLAPADVLTLEAFAAPFGEKEDAWRLDPARILAATEAGQPVSELEAFLHSRTGEALPAEAKSFLADLSARAGRLVDKGAARLIECADAQVAAEIAADRRLKKLCLRAGERHLVVPAASEAGFRAALRELGYALPPA